MYFRRAATNVTYCGCKRAQIAICTLTMTQRVLPILFLSHGGGPCFFLRDAKASLFSEMGENSETAHFLRSLNSIYGSLPSAILLISAHWEEKNITVGCQRNGTSLIYDYYGFPSECYAPEFQYHCATDTNLAMRVREKLTEAGISSSTSDRGFDHGVFIPMKLAYPSGNVPIVQISLNSNLDFSAHIKLGEALSSFRSEGIAIIGSGSLTHNLRDFGAVGSPPAKATVEFTEWVRNTLENSPHDGGASALEAFKNIARDAPHFQRFHPRVEHFLPLHVVLGAAYPSFSHSALPSCVESNPPIKSVRRIHHKIILGTFSLDSYLFE